jgi:hypothetical protein
MNTLKVLVAATLIAPLATSNVLIATGDINNIDPTTPVLAADPELPTAPCDCEIHLVHEIEMPTINSNEPIVGNTDALSCPDCAGHGGGNYEHPWRKTGFLVTKLIIGSVAFSALSAVAIKKVESLGKKLPVKPKHKESKDALKKILGSTVAFSLFGAVGCYLINKALQRGSVNVDNSLHKLLHLPVPAEKK